MGPEERRAMAYRYLGAEFGDLYLAATAEDAAAQRRVPHVARTLAHDRLLQAVRLERRSGPDHGSRRLSCTGSGRTSSCGGRRRGRGRRGGGRGRGGAARRGRGRRRSRGGASTTGDGGRARCLDAATTGAGVVVRTERWGARRGRRDRSAGDGVEVVVDGALGTGGVVAAAVLRPTVRTGPTSCTLWVGSRGVEPPGARTTSTASSTPTTASPPSIPGRWDPDAARTPPRRTRRG